MKKSLFAIALVMAIAPFTTAQGLKTPAPSPTALLKQDFGLASIEVSYSRPGMKGRTIFGDLVPFGKVWRTGANNATTISFGDDVTFGNTKVPAGKYGLLSIPGASEWTIILTKQLDVTSPAAYKQDQDVARYTAAVQNLPFSIETFTMVIGDVKPTSCGLGLMWDNVYVEVPITTDIDSKVMAQIESAMKGNNPPYFAAAMYYMETNRDANTALGWLEKAAVQSPDAYWVLYQKANCLAKLGRNEEAKKAAEIAMAKAKAAQNSDYVKLNEDLIKKL